jgi:hypothetical protein
MSNIIRFSIKHYWIDIQCLDTPVINRWYESIQELYSQGAICCTHLLPNYLDRDNNAATRLYNQIIADIAIIKKLGVPWEEDEPEVFNYDTAWCNRIHRRFTTMDRFNNRLDINSSQKFQINPEDFETYHTAIHRINANVHKIEQYCITTQKAHFRGKQQIFIVEPAVKTSYVFNHFTKEDFQYHTWEHYNVIFDEEILGKTILTSFFDNDNPKQLDTSGHAGWYGAFKILFNKGDQEIYNSEEFNNWLIEHNTSKEKQRANFPIGNIVASSHPLDEIFKTFINPSQIPQLNDANLTFRQDIYI